jgi:hypothetical protein
MVKRSSPSFDCLAILASQYSVHSRNLIVDHCSAYGLVNRSCVRTTSNTSDCPKKNMLVWLYHLPNTCIALLFGLTGTALFMGVLFLRIKLLRLDVQADHAKAAHDALAVVIGFAGLILAFSLVQEQNYVRNLETQVGAEANSLSRLDRLLVRFGEPGTTRSGYRSANMQTQLLRTSGQN